MLYWRDWSRKALERQRWILFRCYLVAELDAVVKLKFWIQKLIAVITTAGRFFVSSHTCDFVLKVRDAYIRRVRSLSDTDFKEVDFSVVSEALKDVRDVCEQVFSLVASVCGHRS